MINENFLNMLKGLNYPNKIEAVKIIMAKCKEQMAVDNKFYKNPNKVQKCINEIFNKIRTSDKYLEALVRIETTTPYSIFSYILNENVSDIMFHGYGYKLTDSGIYENIEIPDELLDIYILFIEHFIENIIFSAEKKFDVAHADLDAELDKLRFNLTHKSLTKDKHHLISIRKQTIKHSIHTIEDYMNSINASKSQEEIIHKYAQKGNFVIFGEVGSGKTTLLNYMGNYNLEEKKNLCTIEDTDELNIDVPISLLTNHHFKIKDLFIKALRQNPSGILVGETRTDEIVDILESALTISVGTTIHANSFQRAIQRIIFMSIERNIPPEQILDLINASIDCFIFMKKRKLKEIWVHKPGVVTNIYEAYEKIE